MVLVSLTFNKELNQGHFRMDTKKATIKLIIVV